MTAVWSGIDPNRAEAQLRAISRRLIDLDDALRAQQDLLRSKPDSFALRLGAQSLIHMQERLRLERLELVHHRVAEKIDVSLDGAIFRGHAANIGFLGTFLIRLQKLYSSIAQAIGQGPTLRGPISRDIIRGTELRLATTFPSSFGMSVFVETQPDLIGESLASSSLEVLFQLLQSSVSEVKLMQLSGELGGRSINHFRHIISSLSQSDAELSVEWSDSSGIKHYWHIDSHQSADLVDKLSLIKENRSETKSFDGYIVGASLLRNRFELLIGDGSLIEGKTVAGVVPKLRDVFGRKCTAVVDEMEITDRASGDARIYYSLIDVHLN